jgi:hypothetical protein
MYGKMGGKATVSVCAKRDYMGGVRKFLDRLPRIDNPFWTPHGPEPFSGISGSHFGQESRQKSRPIYVSRMIHYTNYCTVVFLLVSYRVRSSKGIMLMGIIIAYNRRGVCSRYVKHLENKGSFCAFAP